MMEKLGTRRRSLCVICGEKLEQPPTGRPPSYCSPVCRRTAEMDLRHINSLILTAEKKELDARAKALTAYNTATHVRVADFWAGEAVRLRAQRAEILSRSATEGGEA